MVRNIKNKQQNNKQNKQQNNKQNKQQNNNQNKQKNKQQNNNQNQQGGRVTMASEFFGQNSGKYFELGSPQLQISNSAYGVNLPTARGMNIGNNLVGPDLGPTSHSGIQTGGNQFNKILNPETNRLVNVNGKIGKKIINNYVKYLNNH